MNTTNQSAWSRRDVLGALAASAVLPVQKASAALPRRVGIVGGGMAGVSLAFLLNGKRDVVLLEAGASVGGNVQTVPIELDGQTFPVDMGAQYFNPVLYPNYVNLIDLLGLAPEVHSFSASITQFANGEANPRFVSPLLPGRAWPLLEPWNRTGLKAFTVAFADAKKREAQDADWSVTMEDWLATLNLPREDTENTVLPWTASLYSGITDEARGLSARAAMIFVAKTLPDNPLNPILYYVLKPGMATVLNTMIARCSTVNVMTSAQVTLVTPPRRADSRFGVRTGASLTWMIWYSPHPHRQRCRCSAGCPIPWRRKPCSRPWTSAMRCWRCTPIRSIPRPIRHSGHSLMPGFTAIIAKPRCG